MHTIKRLFLSVESFNEKEENGYLYKLYKYLFFCRNLKKVKIKVIHIVFQKKRDKIDFSTKLSTLSTKKGVKSVDYFSEKKNKCFVNKS